MTTIMTAESKSTDRTRVDDRPIELIASGRQSPMERDEWTVVGQPLRDVELRKRVIATLNLEATLTGIDRPSFDDRDFSSVLQALDDAYARVATEIRGIDPAFKEELLNALVAIAQVRTDVVDARGQQLRNRYAAVRSALSRLRGIGSVATMMERAPEELCRCGFDRAFVSRVEDSTWWVESVYVTGDPQWAADIRAVAREHPRQLDHLLREAEMMRRRAPMLVRNAQEDPHTNPEIGHASRSRSYVAAPLMPEGCIIGFLHADSFMRSQHVDEEDAAVLWLFAEGFGYALQRTALQERLRSAREEIQRMARGMAFAMDSMCATGGAFAPAASAPFVQQGPVTAALVPPQSRLEELLSRREIEVLALMANGKSNGEIANHLVISEGTVKSHVKHILRKLRASNRAEAVYRFMRMTAIDGPPNGQRTS